MRELKHRTKVPKSSKAINEIKKLKMPRVSGFITQSEAREDLGFDEREVLC